MSCQNNPCTCHQIDKVECQIARLEAERDKLRAQRDYLLSQIPVIHFFEDDDGLCKGCNKTIFELPKTDRVTMDREKANCKSIQEMR